jgi:hypothetical protein
MQNHLVKELSMLPDSIVNNWVWIVVGLGVLAVVWFVVRTIFKLTMRMFACGCAVLLGLALGAAALAYFGAGA